MGRSTTLPPTSKHGRIQGDDGAVVAEFALILPFLATIAMGTIEFGIGWKQQITLKNTVRAAARQATNLGDDRTADYYALSSLKSGLAELKNTTLQYVSIYRTTATDGAPANASCIPTVTPTLGTGFAGDCNIYIKSQIDSLPATPIAPFAATCTGNSGTASDHFWCPTGRNAEQGDPPDYVGVFARVTYTTSTKMFGSSFTMTDRFVMRIEPRI